jgi:uncharacterized protein (DUF362 family)
MTSEPRQRSTSPSPLVAALAEAVIEQHAKRAGLVAEVVANVVDVVKANHGEPALPQVPKASSSLRNNGLMVIDGGRRAQTQP